MDGIDLLLIGSAVPVASSGPTLTVDATNWPVAAAMVANGLILIFSIFLVPLWWNNRDDRALLWLAISGFGWTIRYAVSFGMDWPEPETTAGVIYYSASHLGVGMALAFCAEFIRLPATGIILRAVFGLTILSIAATVLSWNAEPVLYTATLISMGQLLVLIVLMVKAWRRSPALDHGLILGAVLLILPMAVHDTGRFDSNHWWDGLGFQTQPFAAFILIAACQFALGRRYLWALAEMRNANAHLEFAIDQTRDSLAASEAARRELEVERAIESERERLMREMHDGIGSNLVTALAIAQKADESPRTIATLKRAISDLKITVDSLAPVDGDVVALLANFRHRAGPDLAEAGLTCEWSVENCPSLPWLTAENALHMLRIIQEAIGNVLTHAQAKVVMIGCAVQPSQGRPGILISIGDDGRGYDPHALRQSGRGIENMRSRAATLGGELSCTSSPGAGTLVTLWLPQQR